MKRSNDVHFALGWILTQNCEKPWIIAFGRVHFLAKIWPTLKSTFKTSFEGSFHADHNGTIPSFISYSHTKIWCVSFDTGYMEYANIWAMYYARYLGLGMRYGGGTCTIVISMNRVFKRCPFCCKLNFDPKSWKTMDYSLCLSAIFGKNVTNIKIHF